MENEKDFFCPQGESATGPGEFSWNDSPGAIRWGKGSGFGRAAGPQRKTTPEAEASSAAADRPAESAARQAPAVESSPRPVRPVEPEEPAQPVPSAEPPEAFQCSEAVFAPAGQPVPGTTPAGNRAEPAENPGPFDGFAPKQQANPAPFSGARQANAAAAAPDRPLSAPFGRNAGSVWGGRAAGSRNDAEPSPFCQTPARPGESSCGSCGAANPAEAQYCCVCGTRMPFVRVVCGRCRAQIGLAGARFCPFCGAAL